MVCHQSVYYFIKYVHIHVCNILLMRPMFVLMVVMHTVRTSMYICTYVLGLGDIEIRTVLRLLPTKTL